MRFGVEFRYQNVTPAQEFSALKGGIIKTNRCVLMSTVCGYLMATAVACLAANEPQEGKSYFWHIEAPCAGPNKEAINLKCDAIRDALLSFEDACTKIDTKCKPAIDVLDKLFGSTKHPMLADYIVYLSQCVANKKTLDQCDSKDKFKFIKTTPILMWEDKNTPHLYGVRLIYAIVLTEYRIDELGGHVTTEYKREPNPFSAVFSALGTKLEAPEAKAAVSNELKFHWYPLSGNPDQPGMWFAIARVNVDVNTIDRITVSYGQLTPSNPLSVKITRNISEKDGTSYSFEVQVDKMPEDDREDTLRQAFVQKQPKEQEKYSGDFLAANGFFSNSPDNFAAVSLALGVIFNDRGTAAASGSNNQSVNGYALAKIYFPGCRPELRAGPDPSDAHPYRPSLGVIVGTDLTGTIFDEFVLGVSLGHVFGNVGFISGVNVISGAKDSNEGRRTRPILRNGLYVLGLR